MYLILICTCRQRQGRRPVSLRNRARACINFAPTTGSAAAVRHFKSNICVFRVRIIAFPAFSRVLSGATSSPGGHPLRGAPSPGRISSPGGYTLREDPLSGRSPSPGGHPLRESTEARRGCYPGEETLPGRVFSRPCHGSSFFFMFFFDKKNAPK